METKSIMGDGGLVIVSSRGSFCALSPVCAGVIFVVFVCMFCLFIYFTWLLTRSIKLYLYFR